MTYQPIFSERAGLLESESAIDLTTQARVRAYLTDKASVTNHDAQLAIYITEASVMAARLMNRAIWQKARTEYFDVLPGVRRFRVLGSPITSAATAIVIYNNIESPRDFTDSGDLIDTDYIVVQGQGRAEQGIIDIETYLQPGRNALEVTYTGGMAAGDDVAAVSAAMIAAYPPLAGYMDMQVAFMWRRRLSPEIMSQTIIGASTTRMQTGFWDPRVEDGIRRLYGR